MKAYARVTQGTSAPSPIAPAASPVYDDMAKPVQSGTQEAIGDVRFDSLKKGPRSSIGARAVLIQQAKL